MKVVINGSEADYPYIFVNGVKMPATFIARPANPRVDMGRRIIIEPALPEGGNTLLTADYLDFEINEVVISDNPSAYTPADVLRFLNEGHESPTDDDFPGIGSGLYSGGGGSPEIPDGSITTAKLADNAVTSAKIKPCAVGTSQLAIGAVSGDIIQSKTIVASKLADKTITGTQIADGAVTEAKLAPSSVATEKLQDLCVTTPKIADHAVDTTKLNTGGPPPGAALSRHKRTGTLSAPVFVWRLYSSPGDPEHQHNNPGHKEEYARTVHDYAFISRWNAGSLRSYENLGFLPGIDTGEITLMTRGSSSAATKNSTGFSIVILTSSTFTLRYSSALTQCLDTRSPFSLSRLISLDISSMVSSLSMP